MINSFRLPFDVRYSDLLEELKIGEVRLSVDIGNGKIFGSVSGCRMDRESIPGGCRGDRWNANCSVGKFHVERTCRISNNRM